MTGACAETMALFDVAWDARMARMDAELERIAKTARWLGRQLGDRDLTRSDANLRLEALCRQRPHDDERWVPAWRAEKVAIAAFRQGFDAATAAQTRQAA